MARKLTSEEVEAALRSLSGWKLNPRGAIEHDFKFGGFPEAFSFMSRIAFEAERLDHHPDWSNSFNRVKIELMTHDAGGITDKDLELARIIDRISWT